MTETAGKPSTRRASRAKGLKIERIHTTEGVHPYDEVTWETRDVVQLEDRRDDLRAAGCRVPGLLVAQRLDDRHDEVLPRRRRLSGAGVGP